MRINQITLTNDVFKCGNFIAPLLNKMHTDPNFLFGFKLCYVSRYLKILLSKTLIQKIYSKEYYVNWSAVPNATLSVADA